MATRSPPVSCAVAAGRERPTAAVAVAATQTGSPSAQIGLADLRQHPRHVQLCKVTVGNSLASTGRLADA